MFDASNYPFIPLHQVARRITDGSHFSPTPQEHGHLIANVKDMKSGEIDFNSCTRISSSAYRELKETGCTIKYGNVLLSKDGTVGRVVVYKHTDEIGALSSICIIEPTDKLDAAFLGHALQSEGSTRQYDNFMSGSALRRLVLRDIRSIHVPLPESNHQHTIAKVLDTLDITVRQTEAIIEKLKQVKQGLLHDLLTRGIDANGELRPPHSEAPELYKESTLGWIPREWTVASANEVCESIIDCKNRTPPDSATGHAVIRTPNIRSGRFVRTGLALTDPVSYSIWTQRGKPQAGDVLITREAPVGEVCLLPEDIGDACLGQRMMLYRPAFNSMTSDFMLISLLSAQVQKILSDLSGGSTVGHVRVGDIRNLPIHVPPLHEQAKISSIYSSNEKLLEKEDAFLGKLRLQKSGLMDDLLTGRVRVTPLLNTPD